MNSASTKIRNWSIFAGAMPEHRKLLRFLIPLVLCCFTLFPGTAQEVLSVKWVSQFPPEGKPAAQKSLLRRLAEVVTGKDERLSLTKPVAVTASKPGHLFLLDQGNGAVLEVNEGKIMIPFRFGKKLTGFPSLVGLCSLPGGELLFTDSRMNSIFRISPSVKNITAFTDTGSLTQPTGIAYSEAVKSIWVVETAKHRVQVLDLDGHLIKIIGTRGKGAAEFNFPTAVCIDSTGNAYIVDAMNFRVQIFDKDGRFVSMFGEQGDASGYLARPKGIAVDSFGNIYISDALFHNVQVFDHKGSFLYGFGRQGHGRGEFWMPAGIYIDENNYLYVADSYNSRIQVFRLVKTE